MRDNLLSFEDCRFATHLLNFVNLATLFEGEAAEGCGDGVLRGLRGEWAVLQAGTQRSVQLGRMCLIVTLCRSNGTSALTKFLPAAAGLHVAIFLVSIFHKGVKKG